MVVLYANGLSEEQVPSNHTYTDDEILYHFTDFDKVKSHRLSEVPNTWCVWGENKPVDKREDEFNQIASAAIDKEIYSPLFFIHDTELDPSWKLTDDIIQYGYNKFKKEILKYLDSIAMVILEEQEKIRKQSGGSGNNMIALEQTGISIDKRIVYKFDINKQMEELFLPNNFTEFAIKVHDFLRDYYADGEIFVIFADKNILIELEDDHVKPLIDKIIDTLSKQQKYEMCSELKNVYERWSSFKAGLSKPVKPRRKRPKKASGESENLTQ